LSVLKLITNLLFNPVVAPRFFNFFAGLAPICFQYSPFRCPNFQNHSSGIACCVAVAATYFANYFGGMMGSTDVASCYYLVGGQDFAVGAAAFVAAYWYDVACHNFAEASRSAAFHNCVEVSPGLTALSELEVLHTGRVAYLLAPCEVFHMCSSYSDLYARTPSFVLALAQSVVPQMERSTS
jgi:hypothetical protein